MNEVVRQESTTLNNQTYESTSTRTLFTLLFWMPIAKPLIIRTPGIFESMVSRRHKNVLSVQFHDRGNSKIRNHSCARP